MAPSSRALRIGIALLISAGFVAAGYYFSSPLHINIVGATSTEALLKEYAKKDTDGDGLADWQESLYGTDPGNAHSVDAAHTDQEAVDQGLVKPKFQTATSTPKALTDKDFPIKASTPGSYTDQFSQAFMERFLTSSANGALSSESQQALVTQLLAEFSAKAAVLARSSYTNASVRVSADTSITAYTVALRGVFAAHEFAESDGTLLSTSEDFFVKSDPSARPKLVRMMNTFAAVAKDLTAVSVPPALANDHLVLIQSFDTMGKIAKLAASYETDPIAALGGYAAYKPAAAAIKGVWIDMSGKILAEGEPAAGSPAATVVDYARAAQSATP